MQLSHCGSNTLSSTCRHRQVCFKQPQDTQSLTGCPAVDYCLIWWQYFSHVSCALVHAKQTMHLVKASHPCNHFWVNLVELHTFIYICISSNSTRTVWWRLKNRDLYKPLLLKQIISKMILRFLSTQYILQYIYITYAIINHLLGPLKVHHEAYEAKPTIFWVPASLHR